MPSSQPLVHLDEAGRKQTIESGGSQDLKAGSKVTRAVVTKTANYTVLASESGATFLADAVDLVFTLPPTAKGLRYAFFVKAVSAVTGLSISPAAADKILGNGFTSLDDKDAINTAATDREGDIISLVGDGDQGWYIEDVVGIWAREA